MSAAGAGASEDSGPNLTDFFNEIAPMSIIYIRCNTELSEHLYNTYSKHNTTIKEGLKDDCKSSRVLAEAYFRSYNNETKQVNLIIKRILFSGCLSATWINLGIRQIPTPVNTVDTLFYKTYPLDERFYPLKKEEVTLFGGGRRRSNRRRPTRRHRRRSTRRRA